MSSSRLPSGAADLSQARRNSNPPFASPPGCKRPGWASVVKAEAHLNEDLARVEKVRPPESGAVIKQEPAVRYIQSVG